MADTYPNETRLRFAELIFRGMSAKEASMTLKIPPGRGKEWLKRADVRAQINALKEQFMLGAGHEIELGKQFLRKKIIQLDHLTADSKSVSDIARAMQAVQSALEYFEPDGQLMHASRIDVFEPEWLREQRPQ